MFVEPVPDGGQAGGYLAARQLYVRAEAGQGAVRRADDLADGIVGRFARQAVAAALAVRSLDQSVLCQRTQDALKILLRQLLPLGDLPHGDKAAAMLRQIQQDQNRVAAHG